MPGRLRRRLVRDRVTVSTPDPYASRWGGIAKDTRSTASRLQAGWRGGGPATISVSYRSLSLTMVGAFLPGLSMARTSSLQGPQPKKQAAFLFTYGRMPQQDLLGQTIKITRTTTSSPPTGQPAVHRPASIFVSYRGTWLWRIPLD